MQRLLAMVPWIAAHDGPTLVEVCERFGLTEKELAADLEVMWLVGLPPYTPDALIDVVQEGDRVWIHFADVFDAPQRLTPDQAVALLTAGASVLALPGHRAPTARSARGVAKLAAVLGVDADQVLDVDLGLGGADVLEVLRTAVRRAPPRPPRLLLLRSRRAHRARRRPVPRARRGRQPLRARALPPRRGRASLPGRPHRRPPRSSTTTFEPPAADRAGRRLPARRRRSRASSSSSTPSAAWVAEAYPVEQVETRADGTLRVRLAVAAEAWFERLLVGLGPQARVVDAPASLADAGRRASDAHPRPLPLTRP